MGVSTNSKLTLLPGVAEIVRAQTDGALDESSKVLGILADSASTEGANEAIDSANDVKQSIGEGKLGNYPLPTPAAYGNEGGSNPSYTMIDSFGQVMHSSRLGNNNEMYNNNDPSDYRTQGTINSGSNTNTYWVQATPNSGADGHIMLDAPSTPGYYSDYSAWLKNWRSYSNNFPYYGTMVTGRDGRQLYSPYFSGTTLQWRHRGGYDYIETLGVSSSTYSTWNGGQQSAAGMVTYNGRTNTLALIETRSQSNDYRIHVWKNVNVDLDTEDFVTGDLHSFLSQAKAVGTPLSLDANAYYYYNDFSLNRNSSSSYNESRYRAKIFISDDGTKVGFSRMTPSNEFIYAVINLDFATTTAVVDFKQNLGLTTSYGWEQGSNYGIRHEITWDNKWAVTFCPYYYYGSGMMAYFQSTEDPDVYYYASDTDTNWGCQIFPFHRSKFGYNKSSNNADGNQGARLNILDPDGMYQNGYYDNSAISTGSSFSFNYNDQLRYTIDMYYTSTNYPVWFSPTRWSHN